MRFYFNISDRLPIRDEVGCDFKLASEAVLYAKYLAADLRCLEADVRPPRQSIQVVGEGLEQVHEEAVFSWSGAHLVQQQVETSSLALPSAWISIDLKR
jgi:hypothetical protein